MAIPLRILSFVLMNFLFFFVLSASVYAACTSPTGEEGALNYNTTNHLFEYCDDTGSWKSLDVGALSSLGDVAVSAPSDGDVLLFNSTAKKWQNQATANGYPTGFIGMFNMVSCPTGWSLLTESQGYFPRGIDVGATGADPDGVRAPKNQQADAFVTHTHSADPPNTTSSSDGNHMHTTYANQLSDANGTGGGARLTRLNGTGGAETGLTNSVSQHTHTLTLASFDTGSTGNAETRPENFAVLFCRKDD